MEKCWFTTEITEDTEGKIVAKDRFLYPLWTLWWHIVVEYASPLYESVFGGACIVSHRKASFPAYIENPTRSQAVS